MDSEQMTSVRKTSDPLAIGHGRLLQTLTLKGYIVGNRAQTQVRFWACQHESTTLTSQQPTHPSKQ